MGNPDLGYVAHSYIEAHDDESQAFRQFAATRPGRTTLLIDTYDTLRAADQVARLESELRAQGSKRGVDSVRIDSGDLDAQAREVRRILNEHGCREVQIALSGGIDEHGIAALVSSGTPVDAFGVGTSLAVSADAPALDMAYKLQMYAGRPRRKRSPGKTTWPGAKQVLREYGRDGLALRDRLVLEGEAPGSTGGVPLLTEVMRAGQALLRPRPLQAIRHDCAQQLRALPRYLLELDGRPGDPASRSYPVIRSAATSGERRLVHVTA